jgi:uncharacterized protein
VIAKAQNQQLAKDEETDQMEEDVVKEEILIIKMPRPCKRRRVRGRPNSSYFKPAGVRMIELEENILTMPEFEAIRLVDSEEISQEEAGKQMQISQSTLSRILKSGRSKIADAIVTGKAIKIEGGLQNKK